MDKLFICYIDALDLRRINSEDTPYLYRALNSNPWVKINTIPEVDLDPTLYTGVYPHEHCIWQVRLKDTRLNSLGQRLTDHIPDIVSTTVQCLIHLFTGSFDLAAVPTWRRRQFNITKTRYIKKNISQFLRLYGNKTFLSIIGEKESNLIYNSNFNELPLVLPRLFSLNCRLELLHIHSLDILQHWNLDDPIRIQNSIREIDGFVENLNRGCKEKGVTLMILSPHGQEPVRESIDIINKFKGLGIPRDEYTYYIEAPKARFYFHTDRARETILALLSSIEQGRILSYKEMHDYNVKFEDKSYGEYYFILDPGYIFFPNDFYHPLANIFLGFSDWQQRSRFQSPRYRGYHGYLPNNESEKGFMMLLDHNYKAIKKEAELIDFAPTVLKLLGYEKPDFMKGQCVFTV